MTTPKFKVGDRVRFQHCNIKEDTYTGTIVEVKSDSKLFPYKFEPDGNQSFKIGLATEDELTYLTKLEKALK